MVHYFFKQLTSAEVGDRQTHEIYIRLPNEFDYKSFFNTDGYINGTVIQVDFNAYNVHFEKSHKLKFVYYVNSNQEKRIPSLSDLFETYEVEAGDYVMLKSVTFVNHVYVYINFYKKNQVKFPYTQLLFSIPSDIGYSSVNHIATSNLQMIYYGAPGSGKSHTIKKTTNLQPKENVFRTTFHPDSDYASFVGSYKPIMKMVDVRNSAGGVIYGASKDEKKKIVYEFLPQAFLKAYIRAYQTEEPVYLVIEEINRGNCAQVFGDLFQLLDRDDFGDSEYPIKPDADISDYVANALQNCHIENIAPDVLDGSILKLPHNLFIWASMNTSDQSLFPMDSAFKRRWDWQYVPINYADARQFYIKVGDETFNWGEFINILNKKIIADDRSLDKQIGNRFLTFTDAQKDNQDNPIGQDVFVNKVLFYLWNDIYKDAESNNIFGDDGFEGLFDGEGQADAGKLDALMHKILGNDYDKAVVKADGKDSTQVDPQIGA